MQIQQRLVRVRPAGTMLAVVLIVAALLALVAIRAASPTFVGGSSGAAQSVTIAHEQAPDALDRNAQLRHPVCDSSICNPNSGSAPTSRAGGPDDQNYHGH
jgi:hypothetical protein